MSSAEVGSSRTTNAGRVATARAIPTRCFWPPLSWSGRRLSSAGSRCTRSISSRSAASESRAVQPQRLAQRLAHAHARVQAGVRVLEDHLDVTPQAAEAALGEPGDVLAAEQDPAAGRVGQPHDAARGRRLAAAALADQRQRLARMNRERDAVDRAHDRAVAVELLAQVLDAHDRLVLHASSSTGGRSGSGTRLSARRIEPTRRCVYGWAGRSKISRAGPDSTTRPS